ncbi:hypothetical protein [Caballeronia sp. S22]|uniref:hypothetical protein n=1 Tax=Caballeronia sp. S22 TaxID=3137182 RepID=UPI0035311768
MLSNADATVTPCHSRTVELEDEIRRADILVGAVRKPHFVRSSWIRDGAVVVDAGYHTGGIGDIEPDGHLGRCNAITPVLGSVGPMTIAMLVAQTLLAAQRAYARSSA